MLMMAGHYGSGANYIIVGCHLIFRIVRISDAKLRRHLFWVTKTRFISFEHFWVLFWTHQKLTLRDGGRPYLQSQRVSFWRIQTKSRLWDGWVGWLRECMAPSYFCLSLPFSNTDILRQAAIQQDVEAYCMYTPGFLFPFRYPTTL